jgi:hypothetical protein
MLGAGIEEYLMTMGVLVSFVGSILFAAASRKEILNAFKGSRLRAEHLIFAAAILLVFISVEGIFIKPTQLLFFDDVIYQNMAVNILHMGQAWMCNYGNAFTCFSGQVFHEPVGTAFLLALGFLAFGANLGTTYGTFFLLSAIAVIFTFFAALLLFKKVGAALFSELLVAVAPVLLVWAKPTSSDLPSLAFSSIAVFALLVFIKEKNVRTFSFAGFAVVLLAYMKVFNAIYVLLIPLLYIILDDKNLRASISKNLKRAYEGMLNLKLLAVLLVLVLVISPEIGYSYQQLVSGTYGNGSAVMIQNTCNTSKYMPSNSSISLKDFGLNSCANVLFWFNAYRSDYVMQPAIFTLLAVAGAAMLFFRNKRALLAIGLWFLVIFIIITAFYAGGVTYGVDWRFMLGLIEQSSLLGGFGAYSLFEFGRGIGGKRRTELFGIISAVLLLVLIFYPVYSLLPQLSINPSNIPQAQPARFYEGFVYNYSYLIPRSCIVLSYDPTLFNIAGLASAQMDYLYSPTAMGSFRSNYSCLVLDYGYWCHTPANICPALGQGFVPIKSVTDTEGNYTYGFYYINATQNQIKVG